MARARRRPVAAWTSAGLVLIFGMAVLTSMAAADVYTVGDIAVDVTAPNPSAARDQALARAPREAAGRLFERLVPRDQRARLTALDEATLSTLVRGVEVADERVSAQRYSARFTVVFDGDAVRRHLRGAGVAFAEAAGKPLLVLPVYEQAGATALWDEPNPWRAAWAKAVAQGGLVPIILPKGDLADVGTISAEQAVAGARDRLRALAQRYDASEVLVARAALATGSGNVPTVNVSAVRYGAAAAPTSTADRIVGAPGASAADVLARAADVLVNGVEDAWRQQTAIGGGPQEELVVTVPLKGIEDLALVRRRLAGIAAVARQELLSLSRQEAKLRLRHAGDPERFRAALAQGSLRLTDDAGTWVLAPSDGQAGSGTAPR